jgi:rhomboid protease GluP
MRLRLLATGLLFMVNLAVFLAMLAEGADLWMPRADLLNQWGGVDPVAIWDGEPWRLVTGMFVHGGLIHVGFNLFVLWQVGRLLEPVMGPSRFSLVYFASGIAGFALSVLVRPAMAVGASGAIFGLVGATMAWALVAREQPYSRALLRALLPFVVINLAIGFALPFIDNAAHIGGLIMGFILGYGLLADQKASGLQKLFEAGVITEADSQRLVAPHRAIAMGLAIVLFGGLVALSVRPFFSPRYLTMMGNHALDHGDVEGAKKHARAAEEKAPSDVPVFLLWGRIQVAEGKRGQARALFEQALKSLQGEGGGGKKTPSTAFIQAYLLYSRPGAGLEEALFADPRSAELLCDVALRGSGTQADANLLNECAWLLITTDDGAVFDPKRGLELARQAVAALEASGQAASGQGDEMKGVEAAIRHTLATAHFKNGNPEEARAILERILATTESGNGQNRKLFEEDLKRFAYAAAKAQVIDQAAPEKALQDESSDGEQNNGKIQGEAAGGEVPGRFDGGP